MLSKFFKYSNFVQILIELKLWFQGEDGSGAIPTGSGYEFGVDPNEDPELALALRVSMEEQRARQEAENATSGGQAEAQPAAAGATEQAGGAVGAEEDDPVLARALAMSVGESASSGEPDLSAMTEDEQIAYAMRMSMQEEATPAATSEEKMDVDEPSAGSSEKKDDDYSEAMNDPAFLQVITDFELLD